VSNRLLLHDPIPRDGNCPCIRSCSEQELREIFNRFGQVQTCIVNKDKRHAFVKMFFRKDAERAKTAMEEMRSQEFQLRVSRPRPRPRPRPLHNTACMTDNRLHRQDGASASAPATAATTKAASASSPSTS
jgi:hypothetical protein